MSDLKGKIGRVLRFIGSEGWADEDADVVRELLEQARHLASLVVAHAEAPTEMRAVAEDLLERLRSDTFGME